MQTKFHRLFITLALLALHTINSQLSTVFAQGTAFTYQGQLQYNGNPSSGAYNLTFSLFNSTNTSAVAIAGPVTNSAVIVTNGLFTVQIDFGAVFNGQTNWLQIGVETNGAAMFTTLTPLQQLTPMPYAIFANTASNLSGTLPVAQLNGMIPLTQLPGIILTNNASGVTLNGSFSGVFPFGFNGAVSTNNFLGLQNLSTFKPTTSTHVPIGFDTWSQYGAGFNITNAASNVAGYLQFGLTNYQNHIWLQQPNQSLASYDTNGLLQWNTNQYAGFPTMASYVNYLHTNLPGVKVIWYNEFDGFPQGGHNGLGTNLVQIYNNLTNELAAGIDGIDLENADNNVEGVGTNYLYYLTFSRWVMNQCNPTNPPFLAVAVSNVNYSTTLSGIANWIAPETDYMTTQQGGTLALRWMDILRLYDPTNAAYSLAFAGVNLCPQDLPNSPYQYQQESAVGLWALRSSPLRFVYLGTDASFVTQCITNLEMRAVDDDPLQAPAYRVYSDGTNDIYVKPMMDGDVCFAIVNTFTNGGASESITVTPAMLGIIPGNYYRVRDFMNQIDLMDGIITTGYTATVTNFTALCCRVSPLPTVAQTALTATSATSATTATTAGNFSGSLSGDVTGTQNATVVSTVSGVSATNVASGANAANAATSANSANTIVKRDASGNFTAGAITATSFTGDGSGLTALSANSIVGGSTTNILIDGHTLYITNGIIMKVK